MSNVFRFIYDSEKGEGFCVTPEASTIKARHYFEDGITWAPILWQFCKFLESVGYEGVRDRVIIKDPYGMESDRGLFETLGPDQYIANAEVIEDEEEEEDEEDGIIGTVKPGTPEHEEAMKELAGYLNSLSDEEKKDLKKQGY